MNAIIRRLIPALLLVCILQPAVAQAQTKAEIKKQNARIIDLMVGDEGMQGDGILPYVLEQFGKTGASSVILRDENTESGSELMVDMNGNGDPRYLRFSPSGASYHFKYDAEGRMIRVKRMEGPDTGNLFVFYDADGHLQTIRMDHRNSQADDPVNAMSGIIAFDGKGGIVSMVMDQNGKRQMHNTRVSYNERGLIISEDLPGLSMRNSYDQQGNLSERQSAHGSMNTVGMEDMEMSFVYDRNKSGQLDAVSRYRLESGTPGKAESIVRFEYSDGGALVALVVESGDNMQTPMRLEANYAGGDAMAHRGLEDYGQAIVLEWKTPEEDVLVTDSMMEVHITLKPGPGQKWPKIDKLTLRHNHKLTQREIGDVVLQKKGAGDSYFILEKLPLKEGRNALMLEVETDLGHFATSERHVYYRDPSRLTPTDETVVVSMGLNNAPGAEHALTYAADDASQIYKSVVSEQNNALLPSGSSLLLNEDASLENFRLALTKARRRCDANDLFVLNITGSGFEKDGRYHFATAGEEGIDAEWLAQELITFPGPVVCLVDASGSDDPADLDLFEAMLEKYVLETDLPRVFIFSSKSDLRSFERKGDEHGAFTAALLEAFSGEGDANGDGVVSFEEAYGYLENRLPDMTSWKQAPAMYKKGIGHSRAVVYKEQ